MDVAQIGSACLGMFLASLLLDRLKKKEESQERENEWRAMKTAIGYCRYSSVLQDETSIEAQQDAITGTRKKKGFSSFTGSLTGRPLARPMSASGFSPHDLPNQERRVEAGFLPCP